MIAAYSKDTVVALQTLFGRDSAGPRGSARGALGGITLSLGPGVHAFVGTPEDGTIALCEALAGVRAPLRGKALVNGRELHRDPIARAHTGVLLASPDLPDAGTVTASIQLAVGALGASVSLAENVLSDLDIQSLAKRSVESLSFAEARAVEYALALAAVHRAPAPKTLVLFEPCADIAVPLPALEASHAQLRDKANCVVLITSSIADARRLADSIWVLYRGAVVRRESATSENLAVGDTELVVHLAPSNSQALRAFAAAMTECPAVSAALWEDETRPDRAPVVRVRTGDRDACALAIADIAVRLQTPVTSITQTAPDLPAVRSSALAALLRARAAMPSPFGPSGPSQPSRGGPIPLPGPASPQHTPSQGGPSQDGLTQGGPPQNAQVVSQSPPSTEVPAAPTGQPPDLPNAGDPNLPIVQPPGSAVGTHSPDQPSVEGTHSPDQPSIPSMEGTPRDPDGPGQSKPD
ncbi:MAG: ABC transporter ATP-binding protein [Polyangiaceae bacterium]|nr:ABC transporter ATP-binding protein [Polyangiaceae bacterium]